MPAHKAAANELSSEHELDLKALARAHSTPRKLAERARIVLLAATGLGVDETARRVGHLAQDGRSLAPPVAGCGPIGRRGGTFMRCAALWRAGDVHARADLPDRGPVP